MEKADRNYSIHSTTLWKDTLVDGLIPVQDVSSSIVEITAEDLKKKEKNTKKLELNESN
jgi:hypothetical protein